MAALLIAAAVVMAEPTRAFAAAPDRQVEINARQAFAAGRYDEAIELFAKLYAESLNPIYLRNIGRCHQRKRDPEKAIDAFRDYLAKGKGITSAERKEIQGYIKEMEDLRDAEAKRAAAATAAPATATTTTPATTATPAQQQPTPAGWTGDPNQPPPPTLSLGAPPPPAADGTAMTINASGQPAPAASRPFYKRWWFWTAVGVVVAGAAITAVAVASGGTSRPDCPLKATACQ